MDKDTVKLLIAAIAVVLSYLTIFFAILGIVKTTFGKFNLLISQLYTEEPKFAVSSVNKRRPGEYSIKWKEVYNNCPKAIDRLTEAIKPHILFSMDPSNFKINIGGEGRRAIWMNITDLKEIDKDGEISYILRF